MDNQVQEENYLKKQEDLLNELLEKPYAEIVKNRKKEEFFNDVFDYGVDGDVNLLRNLLTDDFLPENSELSLSPQQSDDILKLFAEDTSKNKEEILKKIGTIVTGATLPKDFDWQDYHDRSVRIYNAMLSIKASLVEHAAPNYLFDFRFFSKLDSKLLKEYLVQIDDISVKISKEYEKLLDNKKSDPKIILDAIDFIAKCGRPPIQINTLKEKKNLGEVAEIITRAQTAIKSVVYAKDKNYELNSDENTLKAISAYLVDNMHLN